jgi:hypothetical protein
VQCWVVAACLPGMQVEKLSALLGVVGTEYTCETAGFFWLLHVLSRCAPTCMSTSAAAGWLAVPVTSLCTW